MPWPKLIALTTGCPAADAQLRTRRGITVCFNKIRGSSQDLDLQRALDGLYAVTFDNVTDTHVAVVLERHAAFLAGLHFLHFVLEALQGREPAFMHDDVGADEQHIVSAFHGAVGDAA